MIYILYMNEASVFIEERKIQSYAFAKFAYFSFARSFNVQFVNSKILDQHRDKQGKYFRIF